MRKERAENERNRCVCVQQKDREGETEEGESVDKQTLVDIVAEITMILTTAEAADCNTKTRDSPTAQSVTSLRCPGISFSKIV